MQRPRGGRTPSGPWNRLKPATTDPLDQIGLPSKGDDRLLDATTQQRYYTKIVERYMSFCSDAGERQELLSRFASLQIAAPEDIASSQQPLAAPLAGPLPPNASSDDLSHILAALRKLREGIVASKRADEFASQVYIFCVRLGILCKHPESYHPAVQHLLRFIHPRHNLTSIELQEVAGYLVLDTAFRRGNFGEAYLLRNRFELRDAKVDTALRALVRDDWVTFHKLQQSVDRHKAKLLEYAQDDMRKHTLKALGRTYLSVSKTFLETQTGSTWERLRSEDGVGWELQEEKVIIRKPRG